MRGQVCFTRCVQHRHRRVVFQRLKRIANRAPVAIVDNQRRAAMGLDETRQLGHDTLGRGADFDHVAVLSVSQPVIQSRNGQGRGQAQCELIAPSPT